MRSSAFWRTCATILTVAALAGCGTPATPADHAALVGLWVPSDGSGHMLELDADGTFQFDYYQNTVWQLHWDLGDVGQFKLSSDVDRSPYKDCTYTLTGDVLHIEDGHGDACASPGVTPATPMPLDYKKAPPA